MSGAQRGLFQMVYLTFNIHILYLVNPYIFITSYLAQRPLKYSKIPWRKLRKCLRTMIYDIRTSGSHLIYKQYAWTANTSKLNSEQETSMSSIWTDQYQRKIWLSSAHLLRTRCMRTKKCTAYNSLTILLRFIYSKCKPLYVNWSMYMPLSGCLAVYYNYDY